MSVSGTWSQRANYSVMITAAVLLFVPTRETIPCHKPLLKQRRNQVPPDLYPLGLLPDSLASPWGRGECTWDCNFM
jgi:hypothetical protein